MKITNYNKRVVIERIGKATIAINNGCAYTPHTGDALRKWIGDDDRLGEVVVGFLGDNGQETLLTEAELLECETDEMSVYTDDGRFVLFSAKYVNLNEKPENNPFFG